MRIRRDELVDRNQIKTAGNLSRMDGVVVWYRFLSRTEAGEFLPMAAEPDAQNWKGNEYYNENDQSEDKRCELCRNTLWEKTNLRWRLARESV